MAIFQDDNVMTLQAQTGRIVVRSMKYHFTHESELKFIESVWDVLEETECWTLALSKQNLEQY